MMTPNPGREEAIRKIALLCSLPEHGVRFPPPGEHPENTQIKKHVFLPRFVCSRHTLIHPRWLFETAFIVQVVVKGAAKRPENDLKFTGNSLKLASSLIHFILFQQKGFLGRSFKENMSNFRPSFWKSMAQIKQSKNEQKSTSFPVNAKAGFSQKP